MIYVVCNKIYILTNNHNKVFKKYILLKTHLEPHIMIHHIQYTYLYRIKKYFRYQIKLSIFL